MNLILLSPSDFTAPHTARITGRRHKHVLEILKPAAGDVLTVGVEGGCMGQGRITRLESGLIELHVTLNAAPPEKLPVVLCCALMRPIVLKRVLQTAASMGVEEIVLFHSRRVEKSFWQSTALQEDEIREQLVLGLEQAKDTVLPQVSFQKKFKPFVEDVLPGLLSSRVGIVADPSGIDAVSSKSSRQGCVVIIGPEGGFIPYEIDLFKAAGCSVVGMGKRILKVETAMVALVSTWAGRV